MAHRHSRGSSPSRAAQRGFTLVEGLVVLVLIGLAVVIAVPNLQRVRVQARTTSSLRDIERATGLARTEALKRHSPMGVVFDKAGHRLQVFEDWDSGGADVASNDNGSLESNEDSLVEIPLDADIEFTSNPGGGGMVGVATVTWGSDGSISHGVTSTVNSQWIRDTPGNIFRIRFIEATGNSSVEKWTKVGASDTWTAKRELWQWKY
jgi:type IV fimbrial biogenesis protein FimT